MELTKYQLARLIGARALQLASGAPPLIKAQENMGVIEVAQEEFQNGVIPLVVLKEKEH